MLVTIRHDTRHSRSHTTSVAIYFLLKTPAALPWRTFVDMALRADELNHDAPAQEPHKSTEAAQSDSDVHAEAQDRAIKDRNLGYRGALASFSIILCQFVQVRKKKP